MNDNMDTVKQLTQTVTNTSTQVDRLSTAVKEVQETAERSYRLASNANISFASQEAKLLSLANDVSRLTSDIDGLHDSMKITPDITTLVESAIEPVKASMDLSLTLAIETAETAIKSSFDTSVSTLNDSVAASLTAFEKKIDALHGSSYGHLTKTTLPELARRIDALEARDRPATTISKDKVDPSDPVNAGAGGDATADIDDGLDATTRSRTVWAATRARNGNLDPAPPDNTPGSPTPPGLHRASSGAPVGSDRGVHRTPIVSPYRQQPSLRQSTIPETLHGRQSDSRTKIDTSHTPSHDQRPRIRGGLIVLPRHSDRAIHARTLGASRFDVVHLATEEYHVGMDGCILLTEDVLQDCGYSHIKASVEDVVVCYNDIILVHNKVRELWYNAYAHTSGPQVDKILHKSLSVFPKLTSMRVEDVVGFYDRLQEVSMGYCLALLPFDAIVLKNRFEGLCPPGLGLIRYAAMCKAFMELLPWLLPVTLSPQVSAVLASVRYESNNGYDYLWRVLELAVPGFDPTVSITVPSWADADNIFHFAQAYLLYFRLHAKLNFHYDDRTRSGIFLRAIQFSEFADTVTTLQSHVNSFREEFEDGYLPPHLRLHGLATSIHQNTQARLRDIATPRARRLDDNFSRVQGVPICHRIGRDGTPRGGGFKDRGADRTDRARGRFDDDQHRGGHSTPPSGARGGRPPRGRGQLARPDRNRRPFLPDVQCAACKRVGHVAKHCDMLATAICLERYMKHDMSTTLRDSIEKEWLDRWKERLGNPSQTPRQVLRAYVEELDITVAGLDSAIEWEYWDDDVVDDDSQDE